MDSESCDELSVKPIPLGGNVLALYRKDTAGERGFNPSSSALRNGLVGLITESVAMRHDSTLLVLFAVHRLAVNGDKLVDERANDLLCGALRIRVLRRWRN